tara:strand:+ start:787 stop:1137 length:351 start_codon:yes stop_codon:yes gene_type:complete
MNYEGIANTALQQIADKGRTITIKSVTEGAYVPGQPYSGTETETSVKAVVTAYSERLIDGSVIQTGDKQALIAARGISEPTTSDKIIDGGDTYSIVNVSTVKPGNTAILYKIQVRG